MNRLKRIGSVGAIAALTALTLVGCGSGGVKDMTPPGFDAEEVTTAAAEYGIILTSVKDFAKEGYDDVLQGAVEDGTFSVSMADFTEADDAAEYFDTQKELTVTPYEGVKGVDHWSGTSDTGAAEVLYSEEDGGACIAFIRDDDRVLVVIAEGDHAKDGKALVDSL